MYNALERSFSSRPQGDKTFMEPAHHLLTHAVRKQAIGLSDEPFWEWGVWRALESEESGRAFWQTRADQAESRPRRTWFDAFKSPRRLAMLTTVAPQSYASFDREWGERDGWADLPGTRRAPGVGRRWSSDYSRDPLPARRQRSCRPTSWPCCTIYSRSF